MKKLALFLATLLLLTACDTPATGSEPIWQMGYGARELIPELKRAGARGIVEFPLNKIIE